MLLQLRRTTLVEASSLSRGPAGLDLKFCVPTRSRKDCVFSAIYSSSVDSFSLRSSCRMKSQTALSLIQIIPDSSIFSFVNSASSK
jgi:hypothetical protein